MTVRYDLVQAGLDAIAADLDSWDQGEYGTYDEPSCLLGKALRAGNFRPTGSFAKSYWIEDAVDRLNLSYPKATQISYRYPEKDCPTKRAAYEMMVAEVSDILGHPFTVAA